jgi:two-component system, OmpR family, sensor histidine kinase MtrB
MTGARHVAVRLARMLALNARPREGRRRGLAMSLKLIVSIVMAAVVALAATTSVALITLTTYLHRNFEVLVSSTESIHLIDEMKVDLLRHARLGDAIERASIEAELKRRLVDAERYVADPAERTVLAQAREHVGRYLEQAQIAPLAAEPHLVPAFVALETLENTNIAQIERAIAEAARWDALGTALGYGSTALLLAASAALLVWLRLFAFRQVLRIRDAMKIFASGSKETRIAEEGPEELRTIGAQFNEMADSLARQHENQLAFLAAVAHDLRTPLTSLKVSASLLGSGRRIDPGQVASCTDLIRRQVDYLDHMIGDLLDASRIQAGRLELRVEERDARAIVREVYELFRSASPNHELVLSMPETPVGLRCDPLRIQQVLNNLVSNAIKYSPLGGKVELALEHAEDEAVFRVSDQGLGIPEADLPYIFEPFRRSRYSKDTVPGVGLGLSVARKIVDAHGGRIEVQSSLGRGTVLRVFLRRLPQARHP